MKGAPNGKGTYKWKNGSIYVGDFVKGLKHGFGKWKKEADAIITNTYEGEYRYDQKAGKGTYVWSSGNTYTGDFENDERHGKGEMKWTDHSSYDGDWVRGI